MLCMTSVKQYHVPTAIVFPPPTIDAQRCNASCKPGLETDWSHIDDAIPATVEAEIATLEIQTAEHNFCSCEQATLALLTCRPAFDQHAGDLPHTVTDANAPTLTFLFLCNNSAI